MSAIICTLIAIWSLHSNAQTQQETYRLATDDIISVTVFNEPDLSIANARVDVDGNIAMPLLNQISVSGRTTKEVETILYDLLQGDYLKNPNITVSLVEYRPFYIKGAVKLPGSYPYRRGLTVEKAVVLAGGFTERASQSNISIIREADRRKENRVSLTSPVSPGDIVTVKESFF